MAFFRKIKAGLVRNDIENFVGDEGNIFFNVETGELRLSDGTTPGGIGIGGGGGGGGGNYVLPTASTSVKGGIKIDGTTITIANQIISVGTVPYSSISGTPTIPTNNNQLSNGAGYITSSSLTWSNITGKPTFATVATSGSYADLTDKPTIPTNNNQLTNGAGYITSSALTGYATETFVTTRGYLTSVDWSIITSKPTFSTVATSGSYADLTNKPTLFSGNYADLTNKPTIPTDISQLTDTQELLGQGGGGINYIENPYAFNVAGDDSTLREISNGETLRFAGATGISITTDAEGKVTITGPDLSSYATQSYVTGQGYITSSALTGYATETYVTTRGYLTAVDWSIITSKPSFATVATSGSYTDLTNKPTLSGTNLIKTFNILNEFSAPLLGKAVFVPVSANTIRSVQLTNSRTVGVDLMVGLYRNNDLLNFFTIPAGNYTYIYSGLNYTINTNDYLTVNVVAGAGENFSMGIFNTDI